MKNFDISVTFQAPYFFAEVKGVDEFYAEGNSYTEALSNLFSVITNINDLKQKKKQPPQNHIEFSVPDLV